MIFNKDIGLGIIQQLVALNVTYAQPEPQQKLKPGDKLLQSSRMSEPKFQQVQKSNLTANQEYEIRITYLGYDAQYFKIDLCGIDQPVKLETSKNGQRRNRILDNENFYYQTKLNTNEFSLNMAEHNKNCLLFDEESSEEYYRLSITAQSHTFVNKQRKDWDDPVHYVINFVEYSTKYKMQRAFGMAFGCVAVFVLVGLFMLRKLPDGLFKTEQKLQKGI